MVKQLVAFQSIEGSPPGDKDVQKVTEDVVRRRKEARRHRRLDPREEQKLLQSAEPHLQALIVAALETCCRQAELLMSHSGEAKLSSAEHVKDRENRIIPISIRLRRVLKARRDSPAGEPITADRSRRAQTGSRPIREVLLALSVGSWRGVWDDFRNWLVRAA